MTAITKQRMTVAEFLVWAEAQTEGRYELVDGEIVRMPPERAAHNLGKARIWATLSAAVRHAGLKNTVFTDGMAVVTGKARSREPDAIVAEGTGHDLDALTVDDPLIVVEVVSPSSERTDAVEKLGEYFSLPSVRHYVIVWLDEGFIEHHARSGAGVICKTTLPVGDTLRFDPPGFEVEASEILGVATI